MKKYIHTRVVSAVPVSGDITEGGAVRVTAHDGQVTYMATTQFEKLFTPCDAMTFSEALAALKLGKHVRRSEWEGTESLSLLYPYAPHPDTIAGRTPGVYTNPYFKAADNNEHAKGTMTTYIMLRTKTNALVPWMPAHLDLLATDWVLC